MTLVGASLGGAIALDFAFEFPEAVERLVLIDAQGFIDGSGPGASLPGPLAKLGISVLGSKVRYIKSGDGVVICPVSLRPCSASFGVLLSCFMETSNIISATLNSSIPPCNKHEHPNVFQRLVPLCIT